MLIGNPYTFAILIDPVSLWCGNGGHINGVFHFYIDGEMFPPGLRNATLGGDVFCLEKDNALKTAPENASLFCMPKQDAYFYMLGRMLPEMVSEESEIGDDFETDYTYNATTYNMDDDCCFVFAVRNGGLLRILGAKVCRQHYDEKNDCFEWVKIPDPEIKEVFIDVLVAGNVVDNVIDYYWKMKNNT